MVQGKDVNFVGWSVSGRSSNCGAGGFARGKKYERQKFPSAASENTTLRTEASLLRDFATTIEQEREDSVMLTQNVRDFGTNFKYFRASANALKQRNMKLESEEREKEALATVESARLKALTK